jgi:hypothetical protein
MATEKEILEHDYSQKYIFISTPMYGGQCTGLFHQSLLGLQRLCIQVGLRAAISDQWQESLIPRARNYEADKFRASEATHHVFIDADQGFNPGDVLQLLLADKDIIVGPVAKKSINWKQVADALRVGFPLELMDEFACNLNLNTVNAVKMDGTPQLVREGGTGLMMIKRSVYDRMQAALPEIEYVPMIDEEVHYGDKQYLYAFFDTSIDPETRHYLSEDWTFCRRWSRLGGEIFILPWLKTAHQGTYTYIANAAAIAELQKQVLAVDSKIVLPFTNEVIASQK